MSNHKSIPTPRPDDDKPLTNGTVRNIAWTVAGIILLVLVAILATNANNSLLGG